MSRPMEKKCKKKKHPAALHVHLKEVQQKKWVSRSKHASRFYFGESGPEGGIHLDSRVSTFNEERSAQCWRKWGNTQQEVKPTAARHAPHLPSTTFQQHPSFQHCSTWKRSVEVSKEEAAHASSKHRAAHSSVWEVCAWRDSAHLEAQHGSTSHAHSLHGPASRKGVTSSKGQPR
ncbi:hypothetical protein LR48_Vigan404s000500 [Vigna angularis]|uniref:Uncharacterized protein n=1 Tax=Phaseolus angularis TaxID=3914 RepID=A0A0L9TAK6_PHAAN|nr:hypothetical protein LR48_Vigan404s000500 [Vigna angularis]